jgi:hypothetical protein
MPTVDNIQAQQTANVSLTNVETNVTPANFASGVAILNTGPGRTTPFAIVFAQLPNVTGVAAAANVTVNVRTGTSTSGTVIGSATDTNSGAGAAAVGPVTAIAIVPAGTQSIFVGAVMSSGTGTAVASATAPINVIVIYHDRQMPLERYDKFFGGVRGSAEKALASMKRTYGRKDGETVFYATVAKRKHKTKTQQWGGRR